MKVKKLREELGSSSSLLWFAQNRSFRVPRALAPSSIKDERSVFQSHEIWEQAWRWFIVTKDFEKRSFGGSGRRNSAEGANNNSPMKLMKAQTVQQSTGLMTSNWVPPPLDVRPRKSSMFEELMVESSNQPNSAPTHLQALESDGSSVEEELEGILRRENSWTTVARRGRSRLSPLRHATAMGERPPKAQRRGKTLYRLFLDDVAYLVLICKTVKDRMWWWRLTLVEVVWWKMGKVRGSGRGSEGVVI